MTNYWSAFVSEEEVVVATATERSRGLCYQSGIKLALLVSGHGFMVFVLVHSHRGPRLPLVAVATI